MHCSFRFLGLALVAQRVALAAELYIQDYPHYTALVPCAQSAVKAPITDLTTSKCSGEASALQSCVCTKDSNSANVLAKMSSSMSWYCGTDNAEDWNSAKTLFSIYCNTAANTALVTSPPTHTVTDYLWDLSAYSDLAKCARSGVYRPVVDMTSSYCNDSPQDLASCVCSKNNFSRYVSSRIGSSISWYCGTSGTADLTSALAVWNGYCGMAGGTTKFPTPTPLPGLVSYYISDLPQYSSLVKCAASAVGREVQELTTSQCPPGPRELVSCACAKDRKSADMSRILVSSVKYYCGSDANADVTSAIAVFDYYCSAGKGLVTPEGVKAAEITSSETGRATRTSSTAASRTSAATTRVTNSDGVVVTGSENGGQVDVKIKSNVGPIIGGAVGGIVVLALAGIAWWMYRRKHLKSSPTTQNAEAVQPDYGDYSSKPELGGTETTAAAIAAGSKISRKPVTGGAFDEPIVSPIDDPKAHEKSGAGAFGVVAGAHEKPGDGTYGAVGGAHELSNQQGQYYQQQQQPQYSEMYGSYPQQHGGVPAATLAQSPYGQDRPNVYEMDGGHRR